MNEVLNIGIFWLIGWIIAWIGYSIYKIYIDKSDQYRKRYHIWNGFFIGIGSWVIIILTIGFLFVGLVFYAISTIGDKLK